MLAGEDSWTTLFQTFNTIYVRLALCVCLCALASIVLRRIFRHHPHCRGEEPEEPTRWT